ncbi:MAG: Haloacid dehalogenase domain protein hydrolase [Parcubacteria group bacterium GW2011_GWA2_47_21]|nr:MAG: Haloacid dehalogenase domain protein hydrolase [Parcubacteria group bacterium GW2011_GWA2_47_21]
MIPKAIVFDFDGVLTVGGEGLKQQAWDILALPWHEASVARLSAKRQKISGGKRSRYDILEETFMAFGGSEVDILTAAYADCYNSIVQQLLEKSGMPEGTVEVLEELSKLCPLFVNSATPEKAVEESVVKFGVRKYFTGVYGQPTGKVDNLKRVLAVANQLPGPLDVLPRSIVFVGDGNNDRKAAEEFGCRFIGIANDWNKWGIGEAPDFPVVADIRSVPDIVETFRD